MLNEIERGQLAITTVQCFTGAVGHLSNLPGLIKKVIRERVWERRSHHGRIIELPNLRALVTEKPIRGWGQDPKKIEAVIKDDAEALAAFREEMDRQGNNQHTKSINNNVMDARLVQGNSRAYSIARVQKSCPPELVAKVMSGEMSPNAALVKSGVRENRQFYLPKSMEELAEKLRARLSEDELRELAKALIAKVQKEETTP